MWDRIQRSLMPKSAEELKEAPELPYPSANAVHDVDFARADQVGNPGHEILPPVQLRPTPGRKSFWSKCRSSFGPFSRPSFIPPAPAPNLAALRGIPMPRAFKAGILHRQASGNNADGNANEQEILEDDEVIRPRQLNPGAPLADIPYDARAQEPQRRWI